jgi:hypothetical protein
VDESTSLHGFADIVCYSSLNAYQQAEFQQQLVRAIEASLVDAGVRPDAMRVQDQGDARMLTFPDHLDVSRVLALMPRRFNDELNALNRDKAPHARMRVRLSFAMGPSAAGVTGQRGSAPIAVTRLNGAPALRAAMKARPGAYLGVVIDDYLYHQYVAQQFRPDLAIDEYAATRVSFPEKRFDANAWIRLVGYRVDAQLPALAPAKLTAGRPSGKTGRLAADSMPGGQPGITEDGTEPGAYSVGSDSRSDKARDRGDGLRWRSRITPAVATIIAAVIASGVSLLIAFAGHSPGSGGRPGLGPHSATRKGRHTPSTATPTPSSSSGASNGGVTGATFTVYGDWAPGVQVYANNQAAASNAPTIRLNQAVHVTCVAPNDSGIPSINAFYRIVSGPWSGTYASCNEFTNGGPLDSASDPAIDPRIPHCASS